MFFANKAKYQSEYQRVKVSPDIFQGRTKTCAVKKCSRVCRAQHTHTHMHAHMHAHMHTHTTATTASESQYQAWLGGTLGQLLAFQKRLAPGSTVNNELILCLSAAQTHHICFETSSLIQGPHWGNPRLPCKNLTEEERTSISCNILPQESHAWKHQRFTCKLEVGRCVQMDREEGNVVGTISDNAVCWSNDKLVLQTSEHHQSIICMDISRFTIYILVRFWRPCDLLKNHQSWPKYNFNWKLQEVNYLRTFSKTRF